MTSGTTPPKHNLNRSAPAVDRARATIQFLGTVLLAAVGARSRRNAAALAATIGGVAAITVIRLSGQPLGFVFAFGNCALFMLYVILGHRIANMVPGGGRGGLSERGAARPGARQQSYK